MQKENKKKIKKQYWFQKIFCCSVQDQKFQQSKKKMSIIKKKGKIHLSLLGSTHRFKLCKISRKNIAIDNYKQNKTMPLQLNRYLKQKIKGTIAFTKGDISPTVTSNVILSIQMIQNEQLYSKQDSILFNKFPKFRQNQICIFRPKLDSFKDIKQTINSKIVKQIQQVCERFEKTILFLPKDVIFDQLGLLFSDLKNKQIEIQTIVISGKIYMIIVYIGNPDFIKIREQQKIQFITKQLKKDSTKETMNLQKLLQILIKKSNINDILGILAKSIQQSKIDTIFTSFLRNIINQNLVKLFEIQSLFKAKSSFIFKQTPTLDFTGSFGKGLEDQGSSFESMDEEYINSGQRNVCHQVQTYEQQQVSMYGMGNSIVSDFKY